MIKFKEKKVGQEFTYRGHLLRTERCGNFRCYKCGIKNLYKRHRIEDKCEIVHKCDNRYRKDKKYVFFKDLGKLSKK